MIWDKTLTEDEIAFYSVRAPDLTDTNLIGFWPFCLIGPGRAPFGDQTVVRREPIEFLLTWNEGNIATTITDITFTYDLPDVVETFQDLSIPASITVVPLTLSFNEINAATVSLRSGVDVVNFQILDRDPYKGITLVAYDSGGNPTSAVIDLTVRGY